MLIKKYNSSFCYNILIDNTDKVSYSNLDNYYYYNIIILNF